jgi:hypothetical protein
MEKQLGHKTGDHHPHPPSGRNNASSYLQMLKDNTESDFGNKHKLQLNRISKSKTKAEMQKQIVETSFFYGDEDSDEKILYFKKR